MNLSEAMFQHASVGVAILDIAGKTLLVNHALRRILGDSSGGSDEIDLFALTHADDREAEEDKLRELAAGRIASYHIEKRCTHKGGRTIWCETNASLIPADQPASPYILAFVQDISDRKKRQLELKAEHANYEQLFQAASSAIVILDVTGKVLRMYPGFKSVFGYTEAEAVGQQIEDLIGEPDSLEEIRANIRAALAGKTISMESVRRCKDGRAIHVSTLGRLFERGEEEPGVFLVYRDITERKAAEALIQRLSTTDELTGVWNRRGFYTLAAQEIKRAERHGTGLVVVYADLDNFKSINDHHGHAEGDWVLAEVAHVLRDSCRASDTVARMGGDEFVILAAGTPQTEQILPDRIQRSIHKLNARSQRGFEVGLSIGTVYFEPGGDEVDLGELVAQADRRMYEAKTRSTGSHR